MRDEKDCLAGERGILLVIADDQCVESVAALCTDAPVKVVQARTAADALASAGKNRPDMVLIDAELGGEDPAVCYAACRVAGELRDVPIVVLLPPAGDREPFRPAADEDYLIKPLEHHALHSKLHRCLPWHEQRDVRVAYHTPVIIEERNEHYFGLTGDMSAHGLFVATFDRIPEKEEVRLSFTLESETSRPIEVEGRVAWINSKQRPVSGHLPEGFGMEFTGITPDGLDAIREFIAEAEKK